MVIMDLLTKLGVMFVQSKSTNLSVFGTKLYSVVNTRFMSKIMRFFICFILLFLFSCSDNLGKNAYFDSNSVNPFSELNVSKADARLRIRAQIDALNNYQQDKVKNFLYAFKKFSIDNRLVVAVPYVEATGETLTVIRQQMQGILRDLRIRSNQVEWMNYQISSDILPEIVLTYSHYTKHVKKCSERGSLKTPSLWLGCATHQNILAMVVDPKDLVSPSEFGPASGQRATKVLDDYTKRESQSKVKADIQ